MTQEYRPLETTLRKGGFDLRQVWRWKNIAVFEKTKPDMALSSYETVIIETRSRSTLLEGFEAPPREVYPSSKMWGRKGWTYNEKRTAKDKAFALVERMERKRKL